MATVTKSDPDQLEYKKLHIVNLSLAPVDRMYKGIKDWRDAMRSAESPTNPRRKALYDIYREIELDPHLSAAYNKRINNVLENTIKFYNAKGEEDDTVYNVIKQPFFIELCRYILESIAWGHSLIYFDHISIEGGSVCELIPRNNVKPEYGIVVKHYNDDQGVSYVDAPNNKYVLSVGGSRSLGIFAKAAPYVIYKKGDMADWATYAEIFGTPFRTVEYDGYDNTVKHTLEQMMAKAMAAQYAVLPKGTTFNQHDTQSKSGSVDVYKGLADFCNKEVSKLFLGNTMTLDAEGGNYKGEVHEKSELRIAESDGNMLLSVLTTDFTPILENYGIKAAGGWFEFESAEDLTEQGKRLEIDLRLATKIELPEDYWYETYGKPRPDKARKKDDKKPQNKKDDSEPNEDEEPDKNTELAEKKGFWQQVKRFFAYAPQKRG